jgi:hypothetical protein
MENSAADLTTIAVFDHPSTVPCSMPGMLQDAYSQSMAVDLRAPKVPDFTGVFEERHPEMRKSEE